MVQVQLLDWQRSKPIGLHGRQIVVLGNMEAITQLITLYLYYLHSLTGNYTSSINYILYVTLSTLCATNNLYL